MRWIFRAAGAVGAAVTAGRLATAVRAIGRCEAWRAGESRERGVEAASNSVARGLPAGCGVRLASAARTGARVVARRCADRARRAPRASRSALRRAVCAAVPRGRVYRSPLGAERRGPIEAVRLEQDAAAVVDRSAACRGWRRRRAARRPGRARGRRRCPSPPACGWRKAQVQGAKAVAAAGAVSPSARPSLAPWTTWPLMLYGPAEQGGRPAPCRRRRAPRAPPSSRRAGRAPRSSSCARRRSRRGAGGVEHGVVAGAPGAEAEVVADQHVARAQAARPARRSMKACGDCAAKRGVEAQHHRLVRCRSARARTSLSRSVAMRAGARSGWPAQLREVVARIRLEGQHRRRQAAVRAPRRRAAPASPGGRGARRRSCRSSARRRARGPGAAGRGRRAWRAIIGGNPPPGQGAAHPGAAAVAASAQVCALQSARGTCIQYAKQNQELRMKREIAAGRMDPDRHGARHHRRLHDLHQLPGQEDRGADRRLHLDHVGRVPAPDQDADRAAGVLDAGRRHRAHGRRAPRSAACSARRSAGSSPPRWSRWCSA